MVETSRFDSSDFLQSLTSSCLTINFKWFLYWETFTSPVFTNNKNVWCKSTIQELNYLEWINELNNASITFCFILCVKETSLILTLSMHTVTLRQKDANADFMWSFCFNLYARWFDFFEAKMLGQVIKFENCFTLSIRIKGFCILKDKLTFFFAHRLCNMCDMAAVIFNIKK